MSADRSARRDTEAGASRGGTAMARGAVTSGNYLFVGVDIAATAATVAW
jgi:hypothetical protein